MFCNYRGFDCKCVLILINEGVHERQPLSNVSVDGEPESVDIRIFSRFNRRNDSRKTKGSSTMYSGPAIRWILFLPSTRVRMAVDFETMPLLSDANELLFRRRYYQFSPRYCVPFSLALWTKQKQNKEKNCWKKWIKREKTRKNMGQRLIVVQFERMTRSDNKRDRCIRWWIARHEFFSLVVDAFLGSFFSCFKMMRWKKENFKRKDFLLRPSFLRFLRSERSLKRVDDEDKCSRCVTTVQENVQIEKKKGSGEWSVSFEIKRVLVRKLFAENAII